MIDLYLARSGNSLRAAIALEECGLPHRKVHVDLEAGEHRRPSFIRLNPFGTVPVMVDSSDPNNPPIILAQSDLIMMHTAEKSGCLIPRDHRMRLLTMQLFFAAISDRCLFERYRQVFRPRRTGSLGR